MLGAELREGILEVAGELDVLSHQVGVTRVMGVVPMLVWIRSVL